MAYRADAAPNCRLFVLAGKGLDEGAFREAFGKYGDIDDFWIVKDRRTQEDKGVLYITFSKASEAALALEEMNGRVVKGNPKPIKVLIANSKRDGSVRDPKEDERYLRLFVIIPKSFTEAELRSAFEEYGDIDFVTVLKDKSSGEPKGFGYVKYHRPYHAALALENCDSSYKPKFAEPQMSKGRDYHDDDFGYKNQRPGRAPGGYPYMDRERESDRGRKRDFGEFEDHRRPRGGGMRDDFLMEDGRSRYSAVSSPPATPVLPMPSMGESPMDLIQDNSHCGYQRLHVTAPLGLTQSYMTKLFNLIPGLEYCDLNEQTGVAYVRYSTPKCAAYARDKLDMFEYPIGSKLIVRFAEAPNQPMSPTNMGYDHYHTAGGSLMDRDMEDVNTKQRAAMILERAGINPEQVLHTDNARQTERVTYCNIPLPLPKPLRPEDSDIAQRLFIVCQPSAVSERILRDAFSRFGDLIDVYLLSGRNFGYAKFAAKDSAMKAIQVLHGQNIAGQRLKVLEAEPMRDDGQHKRQRKDD